MLTYASACRGSRELALDAAPSQVGLKGLSGWPMIAYRPTQHLSDCEALLGSGDPATACKSLQQLTEL